MPTSDGPEQTHPLHRLALFLQSHRDEIIALWVDAVRQLPKAKRTLRPVLVDHIPDLLEQIAIGAERGPPASRSQRESISSLTSRHALQRLEHGFDLNRVVAEYSLLRASVFTALGGVPDQLSSDEIHYLDRAIDYAIAQAVTSYTATQQRTLKALDQISLTALESGSLDALLDRLLRTLADQVPAVDTAAILLREGDCLVSHAVVGLEHGVTAPPYSTPIDGNSFSSMVAKSRRPLLLHDAANEPLVMSSMVGGRPVRALFGVPFIEDGEVVGIAHIGSFTAPDFSEQDKRLFEVMCRRASAIIAQGMLRERLEESEARFRATFNQAAAGIAHVSLDGRWLRVNPRFAEIVGYSEAELSELSFRDITPPEDIEGDIQARNKLIAGKVAALVREKRYARKDGSLVWARLTGSLARNSAGAPAYLILVAEDISALKQVEAERARLFEAERQARQEAEAAVRQREDVMAVVTHDLRNPLAAIRISADLLARRLAQEGCDARLSQLIDPIRRAARRMDDLIGDLLDMVHLQSGNLELDLRVESAAHLGEEAVELYQPLAQAKELDLSLQLVVDGAQVLCEHDRILQVLSNLLDNAIKFCSPGQSIRLSVASAADEVVFSVADTGPGIAENDLAHLFEPYWSAGRHARKGTGLGLFICKGTIDAHGGRIWAESRPGAGATFYFTLPKA